MNFFFFSSCFIFEKASHGLFLTFLVLSKDSICLSLDLRALAISAGGAFHTADWKPPTVTYWWVGRGHWGGLALLRIRTEKHCSGGFPERVLNPRSATCALCCGSVLWTRLCPPARAGGTLAGYQAPVWESDTRIAVLQFCMVLAV